MQALNISMTIIIKWRTSEEIYPLWDNEHLKMKAINTRTFEEQHYEPCVEAFFISFCKKLFYIFS